MKEGRPEAKLAAALIIVALAPAGKIPVLSLLLHIPAIGALLHLWYRRQYPLAGIAMVTLLFISVFWLGLGYSALLLCSYTLPATGIAVLRQHGRSLVHSVALATIFPAGALAATYGTWSGAMSLFATEMKLWAAGPEFAIFQSSGVSATQIGGLVDTVVLLYPAVLLLTIGALLFGGALLGYQLSREAAVYRIPPLRFIWWKMPEWTLIPLALAVILVLLEQPVLKAIGWNSLLILFVLYSLCGLALLEYWLRRRALRPRLKFLVYLGIFLTQIVGAVLMPLAALFDTKFDFRRIRARRLG